MQLMSAANYGFKIGEKGFVNLTGEFLQKDATSRSGAYTGPVYSNDRTIDDQMLSMRGLTRDDFRMRIGEAAAIDRHGRVRPRAAVLATTRVFYSFGDVSHRRGSAGGFYRFPIPGGAERPRVLSERLLAARSTR